MPRFLSRLKLQLMCCIVGLTIVSLFTYNFFLDVQSPLVQVKVERTAVVERSAPRMPPRRDFERFPYEASLVAPFWEPSIERAVKCELAPVFEAAIALDPPRRATLDPCNQVVRMTAEAFPLCNWDARPCIQHQIGASQVSWWRWRQDIKRKELRRRGGAWPALCEDASEAVTLYLRGRHFREWWGGPLHDLHVKDLSKCPVACRVYGQDWPLNVTDPLSGLERPISWAETHVVFDGHRPYGRLPQGSRAPFVLQGVVALEQAVSGDPISYYSLSATDVLVSWSRDADVWVNYMGASAPAPYPMGYPFSEPLTKTHLKSKFFGAIFVSNKDSVLRHDFTLALMSEIEQLSNFTTRIDNWGKYERTPGLPKESEAFGRTPPQGKDEPSEAKVNILSHYKFAFAFENSIHRDYVTEKAFEALKSGAVPVVWGAPEIAEYLPGGRASYIDAFNFASPRDLAAFLLALDKDDERYLGYLKWYNVAEPPPLSAQIKKMKEYAFYEEAPTSWMCKTCQVVRTAYCPNPGLDAETERIWQDSEGEAKS